MTTYVRSARYNPRTFPNGLSLCLDAGNPRSYDSGVTWRDLSGNDRNGTLNNSPSFTNEGPSSYFTFDGVNDNLTTNFPITSTPALGNWTYEIWTEITQYPTGLGTPNVYGIAYRAGTLFGAMNNAGAALYWYGNETGNECAVYAIIKGNDGYRITTGFGMQLNKTYQLVMVNNNSAGSTSLFVNGLIVSSIVSPTQEYNAGSVSGLNIGISQPQIDTGGEANYSYYPGRIKMAKIYNIALTSRRIVENFYSFRGRYGI